MRCCNNSTKEVKKCGAINCTFWKKRFGKSNGAGSNLKAIRSKCLDCKGFSCVNVKNCEEEICLLYIYRFGNKPKELRSKSRVEAGKKLAARKMEKNAKKT